MLSSICTLANAVPQMRQKTRQSALLVRLAPAQLCANVGFMWLQISINLSQLKFNRINDIPNWGRRDSL